MCGRYNIIPNAEAWIEAFGILQGQEVIEGLAPRYNVAPSQAVPSVRVDTETGQRTACLLHWGLIPHWAKEKKIGYRMINARAETVADKPAFRTAFKRRRCLIPANGFYEWRKTDGKQPYNIRMTDGRPFAFAGLWEHWEGEGETIESCTIIVTTANELLAPLHDRMPVILPSEDYGSWIDPAVADKEALLPLLKPYPPEGLEAYPVSRAVNSPKNDRPELIERMRTGAST